VRARHRLGVPVVILAVTAGLVTASCDGGRGAVRRPAPSGAVMPRRDPHQRYSINATVLENRDHGPELCAGFILQSLPPICGGPVVVGWDWTKINGARAVGDVRWGEFHLVGTWDGSRFTPTEPPAASPLRGTPGGPLRMPLPNSRQRARRRWAGLAHVLLAPSHHPSIESDVGDVSARVASGRQVLRSDDFGLHIERRVWCTGTTAFGSSTVHRDAAASQQRAWPERGVAPASGVNAER
jgi:hypothetical protein